MFVVLDTECYHNYFLATLIFEDGRVAEFEKLDDRVTMGDIGAIGRELVMGNHTVVTFNGHRYDMPLFSLAMIGAGNGVLKEASDNIIKRNKFPWELERAYRFTTLQVDHIDIINLLPLFESLKLYAARINDPELQDLPFDPSETIDVLKACELRSYCIKDCQKTFRLMLNRWEQIQLRVTLGQQYDMDLRSKSDAQIAEAVIKSEYEKATGNPLIKPIDQDNLPQQVSYRPPPFLVFQTKQLRSILFCLEQWSFDLDSAGKPLSPKWLSRLTREIGGRKYTVGLGGLHAKNRCESHYSDSEYQIIDLDVTSYYPSVILVCGFEPPHMGHHFTNIYRDLVQQRVNAKAAGDKVTAEVLKITVNGTFGKLGSRYSAIYAPELMLAVTFSGQLALLMLIERLADTGIQCISANTDGVTVKVKRAQLSFMRQVVNTWELETGLNMEEAEYESIHFRDVNNYFARTTDGKIKTKGIFKDPDISKNPTTPIVSHAVMAYVLDGTPIWETVRSCQEMDKFVAVRTVKGGAAKDGEYLGKAVRWYYSDQTDSAIHYISNGNKVAKTDGAMPMMDMADRIPDDIDYKWYIDEAIETVKLIGLEYKDA